MAKFTPLDAILPSRVVGRTAGTQIWTMPWACRACQRMGTIQVNTAIGSRTSDSEVQSMLDRDHYQKSRLCHLSSDRLFIGRLYRKERGGARTYLLAKGETRETFTPAPWPPWKERGVS